MIGGDDGLVLKGQYLVGAADGFFHLFSGGGIAVTVKLTSPIFRKECLIDLLIIADKGAVEGRSRLLLFGEVAFIDVGAGEDSLSFQGFFAEIRRHLCENCADGIIIEGIGAAFFIFSEIDTDREFIRHGGGRGRRGEKSQGRDKGEHYNESDGSIDIFHK